MRNRLKIARGWLAGAAWLCIAGVAVAQDAPATQDTDKPKPAARAIGPIGDDQDQDQSPDTMQPDDRPLTGLQEPTVGTPAERHSYFVPGVSYYNFVQSNGSTQGGSSDWNSTSYVAGNFSLLENWSHSQLAVNYSGGGDFSTDSSIGNGYFQQVGLTQTFKWQRLQLTFLDQFAYLPESQFGFGAGTGLSSPGVGGTLGVGSTGLSGQLGPGQSIFTAIGPQYNNTAGTQINYVLSPRSSITMGGLYSILRFSDAGNIESNDYLGNLGYNYQLSRQDTIGVVYRYSSFHYLGISQTVADQSIQAAYGKKITGRLALQLTGGPEITNLRMAQGVGGKTHYVAGTASATLNYALPRGMLSANYFHGVTTGSGVFVGATTDQVTGNVTRKLTRVWTGTANVGFSRNHSVANGVGVNNVDYNTIFAGASLGRALGRNTSFSLGYTAYIENASGTVCAGSNCATNFTTNQITVGLSWHAHPFVLR